MKFSHPFEMRVRRMKPSHLAAPCYLIHFAGEHPARPRIKLHATNLEHLEELCVPSEPTYENFSYSHLCIPPVLLCSVQRRSVDADYFQFVSVCSKFPTHHLQDAHRKILGTMFAYRSAKRPVTTFSKCAANVLLNTHLQRLAIRANGKPNVLFASNHARQDIQHVVSVVTCFADSCHLFLLRCVIQ